MPRQFHPVLLFFVTALFSAGPVLAQATLFKIDSGQSIARLFLARTGRRDARINVGVARLSGLAWQEAGNPLPSSLAFQIYPAERESRPTEPEAQGGSTQARTNTVSTLITFQANSFERVDLSTLRVRGNLTATYVTRYPEYEPSKAYAGPIFGPPVVHSRKQEMSFLLHVGARKHNPAAQGQFLQWSVTSALSSDAFPQLWNAAVTTVWPAFVLADDCAPSSNDSKGRPGPGCGRKVADLAPRTDIRCAMPSTVGEDFGGEVCSGTPLAVVLAQEDAMTAGATAGRKASDDTVANELEIVLDVRLVTLAPAPPNFPARQSDPVADARRPASPRYDATVCSSNRHGTEFHPWLRERE